MNPLVAWTALTLTASQVSPAPSLRVACRPLVGSSDARAIDEVIQRELSEIPGVTMISSDQVEAAFASCRTQPACLEHAAQALGADEVVVGMAGLDRDSWLIELFAMDPRGAVLRGVSARWRADASQLKTLASDLLNRLFAPDRNLAWMELEPEGGSLAGLTLSLDGIELQHPGPGQPQLLTEGAHRLSILGGSQEIELLLRAAPRDHLRVFAAVAQGTARVVSSDNSLAPEVDLKAPVATPPGRGRKIGGFVALGGAALLAGGAGWAGGSLSWDYSQLAPLTNSGSLSGDPGTRQRYLSLSNKSNVDEGLAIGLGSAAVLAAGLGIWLLTGG